MRYYSLTKILSKKAQYNMIFGERSNGKTYSVLKYAIKEYVKNGSQLAVIRRWQDDFRGKRAATMFDALVSNNEINKLTNGEWTNVYYYGSRWYLCRYTDDKKNDRIVDDTPFAYAFAISTMEHDKSTSYPMIRIVFLDEFITRGSYLPDEFVLFMNVLSTIIRERDDVIIFMCGNTVNKYCIYFSEMGLNHVSKMQPGDIDIYEYGKSGLRVAVEFCGAVSSTKPSDKYFAFDNPKLSMITGTNGIWEISIYPHKPIKFTQKDILFKYFIIFSGDMLQCEIVYKDSYLFTYIHRKTTELKFPDKELIYSPDYDVRPNWRRKITKPHNDMEKKICSFFANDKVFYQDNEIGEIVRNYLIWCNGNIGGKI